MGNKILFIIFVYLISAAPVCAVNYFVSPNGSDSNTGTQSSPFQTIQKAQTAVRSLIQQGLSSDATVYLRGGTYTLSTPLTFTSEDSGTSQYAVRYRSYPNESAIISGGKAITNWTNFSGNIWVADTGTDKFFRDLYRNYVRLTRARHPNSGYAIITSVSADRTQISYDQRRPNAGLGMDAELVTLHNWETSRTPIAGSQNDSSLVTAVPIGFTDPTWHQFSIPRIGSPVAIENAYSLLDVPGEWYHNLSEHKVYYYAQTGENPNSQSFIAPIIDNLITVQGTATQPMSNFHLSDLVFGFTDYTMPSTGYDGFQGNYGHLLKSGDWSISRPLPTAITYQYTNKSSFEYNSLVSTGAGGLGIGIGVNNFNIVQNTLYNIGGNCLHIGYDPNLSMWNEWPDSVINSGNNPNNISIVNNNISYCGAIFSGAYGILANHIANLYIAHNNIHDLPYSGIGVTSQWSHGATTQRHATIYYNRIYSVVNVLSDGGAIYTLGDNPESDISYNVIHDVNRSGTAIGAQNNGIFFDQGSGYYSVGQNIIYNTSGETIRYNETNSSYMTFGTNYFNVYPGQAGYPQEIDNQAGAQPISPPIPSISLPSSKPGDSEPDGDVDGVDYVVWLNHYLQTISGGATVGDYNTNGTVDGVDYAVWVNNYGK